MAEAGSRRTGWISLIPALGLVFLFPWLYSAYYVERKILALAILALLIGAGLVHHLRSGQAWRVPKAALPLGALLLWQAALLAFDPLRFYNAQWVIFTALLLAGFLVMLNSGDESGWSWETALIVTGAAISLGELWKLLGWWWDWLQIAGTPLALPPVMMRLNGGYLWHPNLYSAYLNLCLPFVLVRALSARGRRGRLGWWAIFAFFLAMQFFTGSRTGWAATLAALLAVLVLVYWQPLSAAVRSPRLSLARYWSSPGRRAGTVLLAAAALLLVLLAARLAAVTGHGTLAARRDIWAFALQQIQASPWLGGGAGSLFFAYAGRTAAIGVDEVFHSHNLWLQIAAESGLIGLLLAGWALYACGRGAASAWQATQPFTPGRLSLAAALGAGLGLLVHGLLDYLFWSLPLLLGVALVLAQLYRPAGRREYLQASPAAGAALLGGLLALIWLGTAYTQQGARLYQDGARAAAQADWEQAAGQVCLAAQRNPQAAFFSFQCALANAYTARATGDRSRLEQAYQMQQAGLRLDSKWYLHHANLASYEWQLGMRQQALADMEAAVSLAPGRSLMLLNLAWMQEASGDEAKAFESYRSYYCANPLAGQAQFTQETALRRQAAAAGCQDGAAAGQPNLYRLSWWQGYQALEAGDFALARRMFKQAIGLNPFDPQGYAYLGLAEQQLDRPEAAWRQVRTGLFVSQGSATAYAIAARVARQQGRAEQAQAYLEKAFDIVQYPRLSTNYYLPAYHQYMLPSDLSPFLIQSLPTPLFLGELERLAESYRSSGQNERAGRVRAWLETAGAPR